LADFSVHSFVDLGINQFLIIGLLTFVAVGVFLLAFRWRDIKPSPSFSTVNSRTYLAALGIVTLFVGGVLVLLGTSAPLLTRFTENPSAVDLSYYFTTMTPVAVIVLVLIALFPAYRWNQGLARPWLLLVGGGALVVTIGLLLVFGVTTDIIYLLLFGSGMSALATNLVVMVRSWAVARRFQAGYLSHVGLAIALIGAAASSGFESKRQVVLPRNEVVNALGMNLTFTEMSETPLGFNCHVSVEDGGSRFVGVLPHEFHRNSEGVMKKPYIKTYLSHDLYLSPIAVEQPEAIEPGALYLLKGETRSLDKYEFTFDDFETGGHEGMGAGVDMMAAANVEVKYDGQTESVKPSLKVVGEEVTPVEASFDNGRATMTITGVRPEEGGVMIKIDGDFLPSSEVREASLVLELSRKPLILLFWLGTLTVFISGVISVFQRQRKRLSSGPERLTANSSTIDHPESVSGNPTP
jgi:cytochrome c-type biogenesis protein CcmF